MSSCAQTAQANTTNLENHPIKCRKPGSTQKEEYHTAWRQKERQSLAYICTSTFRVFENELTTLRHGNQAKKQIVTVQKSAELIYLEDQIESFVGFCLLIVRTIRRY